MFRATRPRHHDGGDAGDAPPPPCPDLHGAYSITAVQGQGCGSTFGLSAPQCIVPSQQAACDIHFSWTAATSTLRVDCGGVDSGQACLLDLVRTGSNCP